LRSISNSLVKSPFYGSEVGKDFLKLIILGNHKNETRKVDMDTSTGTATFMEKLTLLSTLYYDTNKKKYQEKKVTESNLRLMRIV